MNALFDDLETVPTYFVDSDFDEVSETEFRLPPVARFASDENAGYAS